MSQILQDLIKEIRDEVKQIRETQLEQGFDIRENKDNLVEHMRRTELLENRVQNLEEHERATKYSWKLISKIVAGAAGVIAFGISIYKFVEELVK